MTKFSHVTDYLDASDKSAIEQWVENNMPYGGFCFFYNEFKNELTMEMVPASILGNATMYDVVFVKREEAA